MSSIAKAWRSSRLGQVRWLAALLLLALTLQAALAACAPASSAAPAATPTGPLLPKDQAVQMGLSLCNTGRITSSVQPRLDSAELTTNQAVAAQLGRPSWPELPPDSPLWLVKYTGSFTLAGPPAGQATPVPEPATIAAGQAAPAPVLGPFPACWAIIEARFGARGTVFIPEK